MEGSGPAAASSPDSSAAGSASRSGAASDRAIHSRRAGVSSGSAAPPVSPRILLMTLAFGPSLGLGRDRSITLSSPSTSIALAPFLLPHPLARRVRPRRPRGRRRERPRRHRRPPSGRRPRRRHLLAIVQPPPLLPVAPQPVVPAA